MHMQYYKIQLDHHRVYRPIEKVYKSSATVIKLVEVNMVVVGNGQGSQMIHLQRRCSVSIWSPIFWEENKYLSTE